MANGNKLKILVTGGAGFIGSNIVDAYIDAGHRVFVIDNESSGKKANINKRAVYRKIDIQNGTAIRALFKKEKFDVVNHHAAQIDVRDSVQNPIHDANINVIGFLNILNSCLQTKVQKLIFAASGGTAYGECTKPADESFPERPLSPYGVTKLAGEKYIQAFHSLFGLRYTVFRYANVFGPRQDPHGEAGVVAIFSQKLLKGESVSIYGGGKQTRDFVFVKDVARANVFALKRGNNQIINIGTGKETSVNHLFGTMATITGYQLSPQYKPLRTGELQRSVLNCARAKRQLNWKPIYTLKEGLAETISFFREKSLR